MGLKVPPRWARPAVMRMLVAGYRRGAAGVLGRQMLLLTTVGRRSGVARTCPVMWFPDSPGAWVIGAGNYGEEVVPGWYRNLVANPDRVWIQIGSRRLRVECEELSGAWREECLSRFPVLAEYQHATARQVPVLRLTPAAGDLGG